MEPEEQLQREAAGRRLAIAGAAGAVLLQLAGLVIRDRVSRQSPNVETRRGVLELPGFYDQHAVELLASSILLALGYLAVILPLDYLYRAAKARQPETPAAARVVTYAGAAMLAIGLIATEVVLAMQVSDYLAQHRGTYPAAREIVRGESRFVPAVLQLAGTLALAFGFLLVSLHAMRVGLLTRFMGVLGVIVGIVLVLRLGGPVLQWFWLGALAALFAGRWPGGVPRAWTTGGAEPWPSARELRERREREGPREEPAEDEAEPEPETAEERAHPVSRKRRRRRRR